MKEKVVVITGAGSGIGRALALEFGARGAQLALNDVHPDSLQETADLLMQAGVRTVLTSAFDVSDAKAMRGFADEVKSALGNAYIIINNAGIAGDNLPGYVIPESSYRRVMDINFFGVLNGCQAFLPQLIAENEGHVINISSVFGLLATTNNSDYCASKFAVRGYTECLATEFQESPIHIHCVHPGGIKTNITGGVDQADKFKQRFLVTPPDKLARHIIRSIQKKKPKIVYGNHSSLLWFVSNFIPQRLTNWLVWKSSKKFIDLSRYATMLTSKPK